ncbi:monocarboxylate permease-like protein-like protein [Aureobasidium pullulans]|nr:monocarboxylate permease-like protein-like protein [Aureobasidium pullulans]
MVFDPSKADTLEKQPTTAGGTTMLSKNSDEEKTTSLPNPFDPSQFPDGGTNAWLCALGGSCCLFASFGWLNCIGVFQNYYSTNQLRDYSSSTVAWISSLEIFIMFLGGPFIGKTFDSYGPRWLLLVGTFLHVFGLMMTSLSTEYYQFVLAQGISMNSATSWFLKKRALVLGLLAAGSSLGGVIMPIMVQRLIPRVGFGWAMRSVAFLILFMLVVANLTVTSRFPHSPKPLVFKEFVRPFGELPFLLVTIGSFLFFFGMWLPINFIILQAESTGMSSRLATYLVPIMNGASLFGRVLPGFVGDKIGRFNVMIVLCYFTSIVILALWIPATSNASVIVFTILFGFGQGAFVGMAAALIAQISPDSRKIGIRTGVMYAAVSFAVLVGNPIGGVLAAGNSGYTGLQIFCGVLCTAGSTSIAAARVFLKGWKLNVKV